MTPMTDAIIKRARLEMRARGWSQKRLAEKTGISQQFISEMLGGKSATLFPSWAAVFKALDMDLLTVFSTELHETHSGEVQIFPDRDAGVWIATCKHPFFTTEADTYLEVAIKAAEIAQELWELSGTTPPYPEATLGEKGGEDA